MAMASRSPFDSSICNVRSAAAASASIWALLFIWFWRCLCIVIPPQQQINAKTPATTSGVSIKLRWVFSWIVTHCVFSQTWLRGHSSSFAHFVVQRFEEVSHLFGGTHSSFLWQKSSQLSRHPPSSDDSPLSSVRLQHCKPVPHCLSSWQAWISAWFSLRLNRLQRIDKNSHSIRSTK